MLTDNRPRVLCLHGGGVSARIFKLQFRCFNVSLEPYFRLVFADGPWLSDMHEDLKPVYSNMGPCRRWSRWLDHQPMVDQKEAVAAVEQSLTSAMTNDSGTGEWVGLIGFSQGAKMAFSMLVENQLRREDGLPPTSGFAGANWRFGVIMAGRGQPFSLSDRTVGDDYWYSTLTQLSQPRDWSSGWQFPDRLQIPTLHVHGMKDSGLDLHRDLYKYFCAPGTASVVEWDGAHRIPIKSADVARVTEGILRIARAGLSPEGPPTPPNGPVQKRVTFADESPLAMIELAAARF